MTRGAEMWPGHHERPGTSSWATQMSLWSGSVSAAQSALSRRLPRRLKPALRLLFLPLLSEGRGSSWQGKGII